MSDKPDGGKAFPSLNVLLFPKPRPRALEKADRRTAIEARDKAESAKVKLRSGGRCEVLETHSANRVWERCDRRAVHVHHLQGGIGVRGVGSSAMAINKVHACSSCHAAMHAHVLVPLGSTRFQRVR